jgi:hypothetical protein
MTLDVHGGAAGLAGLIAVSGHIFCRTARLVNISSLTGEVSLRDCLGLVICHGRVLLVLDPSRA